MDIDLDRWLALRAAYRNSVDASPAFMLVQAAQASYARARSDLEEFQARGALGRPDVRNPDVAASYARDVAELEARVTVAEAEVRRVETLSKACAAKRSALHALVDGVRAWARDNAVTLPDQDDSVQMPGFAGPAPVHVPTPPSTARTWP
jgi:hypothetical protein